MEERSLVNAPAIADMGWNKLQAIKDEIRRLFTVEHSAIIGVIRLIRLIEQNELYKFEADENGNPFASMSAYLPTLLEELKQGSYVHKLGVRQLRAYLAAYRVMVDGLRYTPEELLHLGIARATELLEAADYDPKTGAIAEEPKPGKIGKSDFVAMVEAIQEEPDAWPVKAVRAELDEKRDVVRKTLFFTWSHHPLAKGLTAYWLSDIIYSDGTEQVVHKLLPVSGSLVTLDMARTITRHANALSNLPTNPTDA